MGFFVGFCLVGFFFFGAGVWFLFFLQSATNRASNASKIGRNLKDKVMGKSVRTASTLVDNQSLRYAKL